MGNHSVASLFYGIYNVKSLMNKSMSSKLSFVVCGPLTGKCSVPLLPCFYAVEQINNYANCAICVRNFNVRI